MTEAAGFTLKVEAGSHRICSLTVKTEVIMDGELQKQYAPDNNSYGGDVAAGEIIVKYTYETVSNPVTTVIVSDNSRTDSSPQTLRIEENDKAFAFFVPALYSIRD